MDFRVFPLLSLCGMIHGYCRTSHLNVPSKRSFRVRGSSGSREVLKFLLLSSFTLLLDGSQPFTSSSARISASIWGVRGFPPLLRADRNGGNFGIIQWGGKSSGAGGMGRGVVQLLRIKGGGKAFKDRQMALQEWKERVWRSARAGQTGEIHKLLKSNLGSIDSADKVNGWTALHWAAAAGHAGAVQALLDAGAAVNAKDFHDSTPLHWVAALGHQTVLAVLCSGGANLHTRDKTGRTPIGVAVKHRQEYAAEFLKRALVRRWKSLPEDKRANWKNRFAKDHIDDLELERLLMAVAPGPAVQIRLGNIMPTYIGLNLPRKTAKVLL